MREESVLTNLSSRQRMREVIKDECEGETHRKLGEEIETSPWGKTDLGGATPKGIKPTSHTSCDSGL